jgi:hypothetical protein
LAVAAALLLVIAQFATVVSVDVASGSCEVLNDTDPTLADQCVQDGFDRHGGVFPLLAVGIIAMALGAGRARPAAAAIAVFGAIALAITLLSDVPAAGESGVIGRDYAGAQAEAGLGLWLQALGASLALAAGAIGWVLVGRRPGRG